MYYGQVRLRGGAMNVYHLQLQHICGTSMCSIEICTSKSQSLQVGFKQVACLPTFAGYPNKQAKTSPFQSITKSGLFMIKDLSWLCQTHGENQEKRRSPPLFLALRRCQPNGLNRQKCRTGRECKKSEQCCVRWQLLIEKVHRRCTFICLHD